MSDSAVLKSSWFSSWVMMRRFSSMSSHRNLINCRVSSSATMNDFGLLCATFFKRWTWSRFLDAVRKAGTAPSETRAKKLERNAFFAELLIWKITISPCFTPAFKKAFRALMMPCFRSPFENKVCFSPLMSVILELLSSRYSFSFWLSEGKFCIAGFSY